MHGEEYQPEILFTDSETAYPSLRGPSSIPLDALGLRAQHRSLPRPRERCSRFHSVPHWVLASCAEADARVASTDCINRFPSRSSTAAEIVSRWTSRPTYLTLCIRVFLSLGVVDCSSQQPQPTSKG